MSEPKALTRAEELVLRLANQLRITLDGRSWRYEFRRVEGELAIDRLARVVLDGSFVLEHRADGRIDVERRGPLQPQHGSLTQAWRHRHEIENIPASWHMELLAEAGELITAAVAHADRASDAGPGAAAILDGAEAVLEALEG